MAIDLNSDEVKVWLMFLRSHASLMRKMEAELQQVHGMSLTWLDALVQLSLEEGKRMTHTRLSERMLVSRGGVTRLVDRMEKAGLVTRRASETDRRTSYVVMTEKGAEALKAMLPTQEESVVRNFIRHLRQEDTLVVRNFLARVLGEDEKSADG